MTLASLGTDILLNVTDLLDPSYKVILWRTSRSFWFLFSSLPKKRDVCQMVASHGSIPLMTYFRELKCPWGPSVTFAAVERGDLRMLQYLREGIVPSSGALFSQPSPRTIDVCPWIIDEPSLVAAEKGYLDILRYMNSKGHKMGPDTVYAAVYCGQDELLRWLTVSCGVRSSEQKICEAAAKGGQVKILKDYISPVKTQLYSIIITATEEGRLNVLQWMYEQGYFRFRDKCMKVATEKHHRHIIEWLMLIEE